MSILVHVGRQFSRLLPSVETLNTDGSPSLFSLRDQRETDSAKWLEILRHFRGVRKLEVSGALVPNIASALEQVTGNMARGILPFLRDLHLHGSESSMSPSIEPALVDMLPLSASWYPMHYYDIIYGRTCTTPNKTSNHLRSSKLWAWYDPINVLSWWRGLKASRQSNAIIRRGGVQVRLDGDLGVRNWLWTCDSSILLFRKLLSDSEWVYESLAVGQVHPS
ncbi:hypothetical protein EDB86DRAFT_2828148 [Lactarius hatsudake]|nr:hypothetical protein EDB86DRAFT_2828148 [Lactarius hatsudake]